MLAIAGYFDGDCVRLLEQVQLKKNQRVLITFEENTQDKIEKMQTSDKDFFLEALMNDKFVSAEPTNLNVKKYIEELREDDRI